MRATTLAGRARGQRTGWTALLAALLLAGAARAAAADPPGAPTVRDPPPGGEAHSFQPRLMVSNAIDPDGDVVRYHFEIYADAGLGTLLGASPPAGVEEGSFGITGWQVVAAPALMLGRAYCWRARARDAGGLDGRWSEPGCFTVTDRPPPAPELLAPADGSTVRVLRPDLIVGNRPDPDQDPIDYGWELAIDPSFPAALQWGNRVPAAIGANTTFRLTAELAENGRYCWRARATGWQLSGPYGVACFMVDVANDPPAVPRPTAPSPRSPEVPLRPTFTWTAAIDPEGADVTYDVQVTDSGEVLVADLRGLAGTSAVLDHDLTPGATYGWRARAIDALGLASAWSEPSPFVVDLPPPDDDLEVAGCCQTGAGGPPATLALAALVAPALRRRRRR